MAEQLTIDCRLRPAGGPELSLSIRLDAATHALVPQGTPIYPEWTRLGYRQCPECPLDPAQHERCPVAANLVEVVDAVRGLRSFEMVDVEIRREGRSCSQQAPLSAALSSLIAIYLITSGCPVLDRLRPLVQAQQPFATWQELLFSFISTYLVAQFFRHKRGQAPDWDLAQLMGLFDAVHAVHRGLGARLRAASATDAAVNALVQLDCFTLLAMETLRAKDLTEMEAYFAALLDSPATQAGTKAP